MYLFKYWAESTYLKNDTFSTSQQVSSFTKKIGRMEQNRFDFFRYWVEKFNDIKVIVFDITSISSYSDLFDYVEWGYNRDDENLPQINLGVVYTEDTNFPLYYQIYPGSISDVSTLKNILKNLEILKLTKTIFVLDRGFYSASNLIDMKLSKINFIIPLSRSTKIFSSLLLHNKQKLSNPLNLFVFNEEVLFYVQESISINDSLDVEAHVFVNEQKRSEKSCIFFKKIIDLESTIRKEGFKKKSETIQFLSNKLPNPSRFFHLKTVDGIVDITRKPRNISDYVSKLGSVIIVTNHKSLKFEKILTVYRRKDYVEKIFDILKSELDGNRLRASSKDAVEGRLFIKFSGLVLYSAIQNHMKSKKLFEKYSFKEVICELKKIKIVQMTNNKLYLTEITKRQKKLLESFCVAVPTPPPLKPGDQKSGF